ncbi:MAG TPA: hypothetical protein VKG26_12900 [Bacteroidia bacterium]|nr:hypothetical protein [Bacteroidia bacterium]
MRLSLKTIFTYWVAFMCFTSFAQQANKVKQTNEFCSTKADSADFEIFKKDAEKQISSNQQKIALLRTKKINSNLKANKKFTKKILALEEKNNKLQKRISGCSNIKPSLWLSFKTKFTRDLKSLGDALDDMAIDQYELSQ